MTCLFLITGIQRTGEHTDNAIAFIFGKLFTKHFNEFPAVHSGHINVHKNSSGPIAFVFAFLQSQDSLITGNYRLDILYDLQIDKE